MSSMNTIIEARTRNYSKILQLKGKLDMIVKQINTQDEDGKLIDSPILRKKIQRSKNH